MTCRFGAMSAASGSSIKTPSCESSQTESVSIPLFGSAAESSNDSQPSEIEDDKAKDVIDVEGEEEEELGTKRKLTSPVWKEFKRVKYMGVVRAKCNYCSNALSGTTSNGTSHLHDHLKICQLRKIKLAGTKRLAQPHLRFGATAVGAISVENYTFDQDTARKALATMIILHEYPLSMVDHTGFQTFCSARQPLFKMGTRNTIRYIIICSLCIFFMLVKF
jgi:hypothetical protein